MKRLISFLACSALVAAVLAQPVSARPAQSITVIEHATTDTTTDTGNPGDSVGDLLTYANAIYGATDKKKVGKTEGYCIRIVVGSAYECNWTTLLPKGQIVVQGSFYDTKDSTLAVIGGTGAYASARGSMKLHALKGGKYRFRFLLVG